MQSQEYLSKSQDALFLNELFTFLKSDCGMASLTKNFGQLHTFTQAQVTESRQQATIRTPGQNYCVCTGPYFIMALNNRQFYRFDFVKDCGEVMPFDDSPDLLGSVLRYEDKLEDSIQQYAEFRQMVQRFDFSQFPNARKLV